MTEPANESPETTLTRPLLGASVLLLLAALLARHHLIPAKHRLNAVVREQRLVEAQIEDLRSENERLASERDAMHEDPVYRERLLRRLFRHTSSPAEFVVKKHP